MSGLTGPVGRAERASLRRDVRRLSLWLVSAISPTTDSDQGCCVGGTLGQYESYRPMDRIIFNPVAIGNDLHGIGSTHDGWNPQDRPLL